MDLGAKISPKIQGSNLSEGSMTNRRDYFSRVFFVKNFYISLRLFTHFIDRSRLNNVEEWEKSIRDSINTYIGHKEKKRGRFERFLLKHHFV